SFTHARVALYHLLSVFFLMLRRPPRSTLFPTRRSSDLLICSLDPHPGLQYGADDTGYIVPDVVVRKIRGRWTASLNGEAMPKLRSEEHTSELQSRENLVCRLLLEKKKKKST